MYDQVSSNEYVTDVETTRDDQMSMKNKNLKNGNLKMVMTPEEFELIRLILAHVRLGSRNEAVSTVTDMFLSINTFDPTGIKYERVWFTIDKGSPEGNDIELRDGNVIIEID